jgi:hypothetical protein
MAAPPPIRYFRVYTIKNITILADMQDWSVSEKAVVRTEEKSQEPSRGMER